MQSLSPQSIGQDMRFVYAGNYARQPDMVVNTAPLAGELPIAFGTPLVRAEGGAVAPMGAGNTGSQFIGIAGSEIKSATQYGQVAGAYYPGEAVSVFQHGCIGVRCQRGTPAADAPAYVRTVASGNYLVGGFEAEADGSNSVQIPNAHWDGPADSAGVAELRLIYIGPAPEVAGTPGPAGADGGYYTPSVDGSGNLTWTASKSGMPAVEGANIRGPAGANGTNGANGAPGAAAGFGVPTATVDNATGTPSVSVTASGPDTAKIFTFEFHNLKGEQGPAGADGPSYTLPAATMGALGGVKQMAAITDLAAAPTMEDFNNLLAALRTAGMLAQST